MSDAVQSLLIDLLEWTAARDRTYAEAMAAWRTSCPKMPVWELAIEKALIAHGQGGQNAVVRLTAAGHRMLHQSNPAE